VQLVELLYLRFFPGEADAEAQAQAKGEPGIADQFMAYISPSEQYFWISFAAIVR